ncbi:sorbosone dehydrogenase family protein [Egicoccus sp. AB-alg6-2]|uniref:PQQ-dependent sugar dehydrogenase n=1 Tax=Egicoccus sp. AB-alg6-2 TaxID=3242692 RepID=UPI00359EF2DD
MRAHRRITATLVALLLVTGACDAGDDPPASDPTSTPAEPDPTGEADPPTQPDDGGEPDDAEPDDEAAGTEDPPEATGTEPVDLQVRTVVTGLEAPWDVVDHAGRVLVTERDTGRLLEISGDGDHTEVRRFPVDATGEGGLLGLASDDVSLFVYYTADDGNRVVRLDDVDGGEEQPLLTGIPKGPTHNGGRLAIGPDEQLYVGTGDAGNAASAADLDALAGKILRVARDGQVPADNPFDGSPVWTLGHRNVQGLAFDPEGRLWAAELGPDVDDEINLIEAGQDYGWPEVTGAPGVDGLVDAAFVAQPAEASWSGAAVVDGGAIPQWEGDLLVTGLRGERLWRLTLDGATVTAAEELHVGEFGRLRTARVAPDGSVWLLTSNRDGRGSPTDEDDRLLRVGP